MSTSYSSAWSDDAPQDETYQSEENSSNQEFSEQDFSDRRLERSRAPSPAPDSPTDSNQSDQFGAKASRPAPAPIDTAVEDNLEYVPFNVRDFEDRHDPLMFTLEFTEKSNNYPTIRHKALIPEKYIHRTYFKSPCLSHSMHAGGDKGSAVAQDDKGSTKLIQPTSATYDEDWEDADEEGSSEADETPRSRDEQSASEVVAEYRSGVDKVDEESSEADSIDWEQDPSYQAFLRRLDQTTHLRKHRFHPVSKYVEDDVDCEGCQIIPLPEGKAKPAKKELNNKDFVSLQRRYLSAELNLAEEDHWDGRNCPICGVLFQSQLGEGKATKHWFVHHRNYVDRISRARADTKSGAQRKGNRSGKALKAGTLATNPILEYNILTRTNGIENELTREKFHYMEQLCNRVENEVLEREEFCRVCYQTFQYGDVKLVDHYREHKEQEILNDFIADANGEKLAAVSQALQELHVESPEAELFSPKYAEWFTDIKKDIELKTKPERAMVDEVKENLRTQLIPPTMIPGQGKSTFTGVSGSKSQRSGSKTWPTEKKRSPQSTKSNSPKSKKRKADGDREYDDNRASAAPPELGSLPDLPKSKKRKLGGAHYRFTKHDQTSSAQAISKPKAKGDSERAQSKKAHKKHQV